MLDPATAALNIRAADQIAETTRNLFAVASRTPDELDTLAEIFDLLSRDALVAPWYRAISSTAVRAIQAMHSGATEVEVAAMFTEAVEREMSMRAGGRS